MYLMARTIHIRELSSMMYSPEVFALSQFVSETPYSVLCAVCFFFPWYYLPGFPLGGNRAGYAFFCKAFHTPSHGHEPLGTHFQIYV